MRIDKIMLKQIGPFEEVILDLPPGDHPELADVYLLTGPNGCGKSTILYSIAANLIGGNFTQLGRELVSARLRGADSVGAFLAGGECRAFTWFRISDGERLQIPDPFGGDASLTLVDRGNVMGFYGQRHDSELIRYSRMAAEFQMNLPREVQPVFSWAGFAYAGMRTVTEVHVTSIEEPRDNPFSKSLSFTETADAYRFVQWVANQEFKRLKAKEAKSGDRAEQIAASIRRIEDLVSQVTGEEFSFKTTTEDNDIRARFQGREVRLDLLPDGLKSIVSWVADLLMRLDRIPWKDGTPILEREFLLLLDEVDIHLHPAWQRRVLPMVQKMFPKAQIIASTHSPFVVASAENAFIFPLSVKDGIAKSEVTRNAQAGASYGAVLKSIFGIASEFDEETERKFQEFHEAKQRLLAGDEGARAQVDQSSAWLLERGEEVRDLTAIELRQMQRQLAQRGRR